MYSSTGCTFSKEERLCGKTSVSALFSHGKWGSTEHLKYCVLRREEGECTRIITSVPKRFFKRAVKRNLLKRRIRESYRRRKGTLREKGVLADIMFQYNSETIVPFEVIDSEVAAILTAL